jgi:hypothetical protein
MSGASQQAVSGRGAEVPPISLSRTDRGIGPKDSLRSESDSRYRSSGRHEGVKRTGPTPQTDDLSLTRHSSVYTKAATSNNSLDGRLKG